jgi:hypothetical protein
MSDNLRQYRAIRDPLTQGYPGESTGHVARHLTTLAALISGIVASKSAQLPKVAANVPDGTKPESRVKRFARWVGNTTITEEVYFAPYAQLLLHHLAMQTLVLVIDGSVVERGQEVIECHAVAMHPRGGEPDRELMDADLRQGRMLDHPVACGPERALRVSPATVRCLCHQLGIGHFYLMGIHVAVLQCCPSVFTSVDGSRAARLAGSPGAIQGSSSAATTEAARRAVSWLIRAARPAARPTAVVWRSGSS